MVKLFNLSALTVMVTVYAMNNDSIIPSSIEESTVVIYHALVDMIEVSLSVPSNTRLELQAHISAIKHHTEEIERLCVIV